MPLNADITHFKHYDFFKCVRQAMNKIDLTVKTKNTTQKAQIFFRVFV